MADLRQQLEVLGLKPCFLPFMRQTGLLTSIFGINNFAISKSSFSQTISGRVFRDSRIQLGSASLISFHFKKIVLVDLHDCYYTVKIYVEIRFIDQYFDSLTRYLCIKKYGVILFGYII